MGSSITSVSETSESVVTAGDNLNRLINGQYFGTTPHITIEPISIPTSFCQISSKLAQAAFALGVPDCAYVKVWTDPAFVAASDDASKAVGSVPIEA